MSPDRFTVECRVNGTTHACEVEPRRLLSDFLRDDLGLTGTHVGCEHGVCGACTVLVDGATVRSCLMLAVQANGAEVRTVEGLGTEHELSATTERLLGQPRSAMRLLHAGLPHGGNRDARVDRWTARGRRDP